MSISPDLARGTELAGYRVEALLGRGGMSVVHLVEDVRLKRKVALKLLAPRLAEDEGFRERFLEESELAASLDHPNIVPIYEAGEADGRLFIAMRYVEGSDLKGLLRDGPLAPERALALVSQVATALDAAHARGLVHGDVKPSNVLIAPGEGPDGSDHAYLADFGLTRRIVGGRAAAREGGLAATIDYVAPEQIRGDEVDGRADVYSLGCLLHECLTGQPPFPRPSEAAVLFAHLEEEPLAPSGLEEVIPKALAKAPEERYGSCRELVVAAREALGIAEPGRSRWPFAVAAVGIALIGAALLAFFLTAGGGGLPAEPGADSLVRIDPKTNRVTQALPVGRKATGVALGDGSLWVSNFGDGTVWRIDPRTGRVLAKVPARGTPTGVAVYGSSVLVADGPDNSTIVGLDAATGAFSFASQMAGGPIFGTHPYLAVGREGAWYADADAQIVSRADAALRSGPSPEIAIPQLAGVTKSFRSTHQSFTGAAVGEGSVWVLGDALEHVVWRIDPAAGRIAARIPLPFAPLGIAVGEGGVWVTSLLDDTVSRINPTTDRISATIPVGRGANQVATGAGGVWVTNAIAGTVSRIDPRTNRVVKTVAVGGSPGAIAVGAGAIWVAVGQR